MELNIKQLGTQAIESTTGTKNMRMSEDAQSMVFQLFTKNVYSNPIGTIVREITSNCFDSHVEAGVNAPVIIKKSYDNETDTHYISFIDYGVGMSPDRVENIYGVYFESTKRKDNTQIGGFGIGGKTPLAYKRPTGLGEGEYDNSFYVITNSDNHKYYYCIYEGPESPVFSLLHDEPTTDRNGTEIRIPILSRDIITFKKEMVKQLYYFENVIFQGFDGEDDNSSYDDDLTNDYQIVQGKHFLYRGSSYSQNIHVCLGRVAYPIDFSILGLNSFHYRIPVALQLGVGDIGVTVSREQLDYSEKTIKVLKEKLELVKQELINMINVQYENVVTLEDYLSTVHEKQKTLTFENGGVISLDDVITSKEIALPNYKYKDFKYPVDTSLFNFLFFSKSYGNKVSNRYGNRKFVGGCKDLEKYANRGLYYVNDDFNRVVKKQSYLKSLNSTYYIIEKRKFDFNSVLFNWYQLASVFNIATRDIKNDEELQNKYIDLIKNLQDDYFEIVKKYAEDYDEVEIPENFVYGRRKNEITQEIKNTTIPVNIIGGYGSVRVILDDLFKQKFTIFYGTREDKEHLNDALALYKKLFNSGNIVLNYANGYRGNTKFTSYENGKDKILFCSVSKANLKYFKHCKNAHPIENFYWKMLHRKEETIIKSIQYSAIPDKLSEIDRFYLNFDFSLLGQDDFNNEVSYINNFKNDDTLDVVNTIQMYTGKLSKFMNIANIPMNKEFQAVIHNIDKVMNVQMKNKDVLEHIRLPYRTEDATNILVDILKKVMIFK